MPRMGSHRPDRLPDAPRDAEGAEPSGRETPSAPRLGRGGLGRRLATTTGNGLGVMAALVGVAWVVYAFQPFGDRGWTLAASCTLLVGLAWGLRRRVPRPIRNVVVGGLTGWSGLIAWSAFSPGEAMPTPKESPDDVRVLSWNILHGEDSGSPWVRRGWPTRKRALSEALRAVGPDILCVQEALEGQVKFLEAELPRHGRVGVGRDDGRSAGEHCAILFDADRFELLDGGTFWLEDPADEPPEDLTLGPKRICTWARLRDRRGGPTLRVYNTHLYLTEGARRRAVGIILDRVLAGDDSDEVLVVGDFNAPPGAPSRRLFHAAGLVSAAELAGERIGLPTFQFYGLRLRGLDDVYLERGGRRVGYQLVDVKPGNTFPSDHFGILADLRAGP